MTDRSHAPRRWTVIAATESAPERSYELSLEGDTVEHRYGHALAPAEGAVVRERLETLLFRGADPANLRESRAALDALRASLDGWYTLWGYDKIRYERGVPVEAALFVACSDVGLGGHRCSRGCAPASPNTYTQLAAYVRRFTGRGMTLGATREEAPPDDAYTGRELVALSNAPGEA